MNSDTGEIRSFTEDEVAAGMIKPPWIPIPKGRVKSVTAMLTSERIAWAAKQNEKSARRSKRKAQRNARKRQR